MFQHVQRAQASDVPFGPIRVLRIGTTAGSAALANVIAPMDLGEEMSADSEKGAIFDEMTSLIPPLRAYARSLLPRSDEADDLVQETLLKGIANVDKFQPGTNLRRWLFTIMRNTFLTGVHRRKRESPGLADCVSGLPVSQPIHDAHMAGNRLIHAIDSLPPQYREIVALVYLTGESYEDAASILGCPIGTVKSRVNRARHMIMTYLDAGSVKDLIVT